MSQTHFGQESREDKVRFNLSNSQIQIFHRTGDPPSLLPPDSAPAPETQSVFVSLCHHQLPDQGSSGLFSTPWCGCECPDAAVNTPPSIPAAPRSRALRSSPG